MKVAPKEYRIDHPYLGRGEGNNGFFVIPHHRIKDYFYNVMVSDGLGWEHVSVTLITHKKAVERCPTWEEMCFIKDLFFYDTERVVQFHPPKDEYVSNHPFCLHLWRPIGVELPFPAPIMVGIKEVNIQK